MEQGGKKRSVLESRIKGVSRKSGDDGRSLVDFSDAVIVLICDIYDVGRAVPIYDDGRSIIERAVQKVSGLVSRVSASGNCRNGILFFYFFFWFDIVKKKEKVEDGKKNKLRAKSIFLILFVE